LSLYQKQQPTPPSFDLQYAGITHTGLVRERNEDSFICLPEQNLWVVADGMGGHEAGDYASRTITEQSGRFIRQARLDAAILLLEENLLHSNRVIREKAEKLGQQVTIGSTVVSLHIWKNLAFVLWAGDSRAYCLRDGRLKRLTEDHSFVEELVRMGKIEATQAEEHPAANVVLNAVGVNEELVVDMDYHSIVDNDLFMLCTDGLFKDLSETDIAAILNDSRADLEQQCQNLVDAALAKGGNDNCTVILVRVQRDRNNV
jgi:serine/threonine protein phosphatase PrpC